MAVTNMLSKTVRAAYWDHEGCVAGRMLDVCQQGIERTQLRKIAADESLGSMDIKPEKGFAFLHVITAGAGEAYGCNGNADFFNESSKRVEFPEPCAQKTAELAGGLQEYHSTYRRLGGVYRQHHNRTKGADSAGSIFLEMYNTPMHRGELVLKLAESEWSDTLQKYASGQPVFWSIGAGVPYDVCSICGFSFKKGTPSRCQHLQKHARLQIFKGGHQAFMFNDCPYFHDISEVDFPAERIAFTLQKVAADASSVDELIQAERDRQLWLPIDVFTRNGAVCDRRVAYLQKLSAIEQDESCGEALEAMAPAGRLTSDDEDDVVKSLKNVPQEELFSALSDKNMMLTPRCFVRIVLHDSKDAENLSGLAEALQTVFSDVRKRGDEEDFLSDCSYLPGRMLPSRSLTNTLTSLDGQLSTDPEPVRKRIVVAIIRNPKQGVRVQKEAAAAAPGIEYLAREYARYQLAAVASARTERAAMLAVALNRA